MSDALEKLKQWLDRRRGHAEVECVGRDGDPTCIKCTVMEWQPDSPDPEYPYDRDGRPEVVGIVAVGFGASLTEAVADAMRYIELGEP